MNKETSEAINELWFNYPISLDFNVNDMIYWLDTNTNINTKKINTNVLVQEIKNAIKAGC